MEPNDKEPRLHEGPLLKKLGRKDREELTELKRLFYQECREKFREDYGEKQTRIYLKKLERILSQI